MNIDMHIHTSYSDGDYTPREVVRMAKEKGLKLIAITDHDECRGYGETAGADADITICPGIELASRYEGEIHVLGLGIDWRNEELLKHIEGVTKLRKRRAENMINNLRSIGVGITIDDVKAECEGMIIGRPHIAAALVEKGCASSRKEAFIRYLSKHSPYYVPFDKITVQGAVDLIKKAGGKAVLAHPGLVKKEVLEALFPKLSDMGFWGVEAYHPSHSGGQCREFESIARGYGLFVTAGSDFHGSAKPAVELGGEKRGGEYLAESVRILTGAVDSNSII
jgi:predicted metal-dependent phosphoesterase TrpH